MRADHCGAPVLTGRQVEAIDAKTVTYYRDVPGKPNGILIWAFKG